MIVRDLGERGLICINQTSHALHAAALCRHWGNADFAPPEPWEPVLSAIAQHDNGWYEWEEAPEVGEDGYPIDFVAGPTWERKLDLWRRGVRRAFTQHPYSGVLVMRHAVTLYRKVLDRLDGAEAEATAAFVAEGDVWEAKARRLLGEHAHWQRQLSDDAIESHTRLLQFGDLVSLRLCVPWESTTPVHGHDVAVEGNTITVSPWPYAVDRFEVAVVGRHLDTKHFGGHEEYRTALTAAPMVELRWQVVAP